MAWHKVTSGGGCVSKAEIQTNPIEQILLWQNRKLLMALELKGKQWSKPVRRKTKVANNLVEERKAKRLKYDYHLVESVNASNDETEVLVDSVTSTLFSDSEVLQILGIPDTLEGLENMDFDLNSIEEDNSQSPLRSDITVNSQVELLMHVNEKTIPKSLKLKCRKWNSEPADKIY